MSDDDPDRLIGLADKVRAVYASHRCFSDRDPDQRVGRRAASGRTPAHHVLSLVGLSTVAAA
jgi:hypothetical protein